MAKKNGERKARVGAAIERRDAAIDAMKAAEKSLKEAVDRQVTYKKERADASARITEGKTIIKSRRGDIKRERGRLRDARRAVSAARKG